MMGSNRRRFPCRYKRDRCCVRSWKKNAANCQRNRCGSREDSEIPNVIEEAESRSVGTTVQEFSNDEDEDKDRDKDNKNVKTFEGLSGEVTTDFCKNCESSNGSYVCGQGMQTIPEEDLDFPDDEDGVLREINGHEEDHRTAEHKPGFSSRTLNQTTWNNGEKLLHSPVHCARHKCSRCSRHFCYDSGVHIESLIATAGSKRICRSTRPCKQGLCCACNYEVSLDAFRSCKQYSTTQTSFFWKMATVIYEISGILKDGLVKLLAEDDETEKSSLRDGMVCEDGWQHKRDVGTGVERASGICIRTRRSEEHNNEPRTRTETANRSGKATECPTGWNSANCKISTGSVNHEPENDLFDTSHWEKSPRRLRDIEGASAVSCASKIRKNTFPPKTTSSDYSISSLSSSSSFKYSCNATEDECVEKKAKNYRKQDIKGRPMSKGSTLGLNEGNSTSSTETTVVNRSISKNEDLWYYDEIDARHSTSHSPTDIEDMPDDEDVSLPLSTVLVEPEKVYEIKDLEELPDPEDRPEYSDKNKQCRLVRELVGREPCPRDGRGFREEIYCDSQKTSETDSATSSDREYDRKRKRKFRFSGRERARKVSSRLNCRENLTGRNHTVKKITSKIDCRSEQPYETCIQSHLEYFKEVEEITLEPSCSKIPRFVRPSSYRFCRSESSGAGGESRQWDQELLSETTAPIDHRRKRNNTRCNAQSTSHHFYM